MLRKICIGSVILALTFTALIANAQQVYKGERPVIFKGLPPAPPPCFPAGPYLGLTAANRVNYTGSGSVYNGIEGIASVGWGVMFNPDFYLAAEVFVGDSAKIKDYSAPGQSVRTTWNFGASLIPGLVITDNVLAYARIGAQRANFRANPPTTCGCNNGTIRSGWHVGLGAQANLTGNWMIRGEYIYSQYQSISFMGTPRGHLFNLGIMYIFSNLFC